VLAPSGSSSWTSLRLGISRRSLRSPSFGSPSKARNRLAALKAFYRSQDGEQLPFDSCRGGKHYFQTKRRKKTAKQHIPDKTEMYQIIGATTNIRDNAIFLTLCQSGTRDGVIENLRFGPVKDQLYREEAPKDSLEAADH
jgi:integrase